jgi:hypothetical protein
LVNFPKDMQRTNVSAGSKSQASIVGHVLALPYVLRKTEDPRLDGKNICSDRWLNIDFG